MTKRVAIVVLFVFAAACGKATPKTTTTPTPTRPPVSAGQSNHPLAGVYVYALSSQKGPALAPDLKRIETVSTSGDGYTSDVKTSTSGQNHVVFTRRWSASGLELLTSDSISNGSELRCAYNPPIREIPLPIKPGKLPRQNWSGGPNLQCSGSTDVTVVDQETAKDGHGKSWPTWKIVETTTQGTGSSVRTYWFSPLLGAEVREEDVSTSLTTLSVLSDYPS